jgi:hypothetical protein
VNTLIIFASIGDLEIYFGADAAADPAALHGLDGFWPVHVIQVGD